MSFCILYKFVKRSEVGLDEFLGAARRMTNLLREKYSSLGSRLHATGEADVFIGYAEWPSEAVWKRLALDPQDIPLQTALQGLCRNIETLQTMILINPGLNVDPPQGVMKGTN